MLIGLAIKIVIRVPKSRSIVASSAGKIQRRRIKPDGTPENVPMYPYEITMKKDDLHRSENKVEVLENPIPTQQELPEGMTEDELIDAVAARVLAK